MKKKFNEKQIPTKARPIQMNLELLEYCKKEINDLLDKKIDKTKSFSMELYSFLCPKSFSN